MSKCNKVKNPCKICLGSVSQKTGLRCQGACQSWVHYACLNYTPGKIKDIKAGIIKVSCPCPDCKTTLPKEYRTDQPYSCNNSMCPANRRPKCDNHECPINTDGKGRPMSHPPPARPCPLHKCGNDCKQNSSPQLPGGKLDLSVLPKQCMPETHGSEYISDACLSKNPKCPSGCSSTNDVSGDFGGYGPARGGGGGGNDNMPSFQIVEQMCNTVGELTNKINELMIEMKKAARCRDEGGGFGGGGGGYDNRSSPNECTSQAPKKIYPKPCFCPGNPARRT